MKRLTALCLLMGTLSLAGCGGNGGSALSGGATRATILLTDSPREDYAHVWATIYKVELIPQDGSAAVTVIDDAAGRQIDLRALRDASGERYSFLGTGTVPAGVYAGAKVTVGATMQLIKNGAAVGDPLSVDSSVPTDASGHPVLALTFKSPKTLGEGTTSNVVIDFNLARFVVRASGVLPAVGEGAGNGLGRPDRHDAHDYRGTVSGLSGTAPDLTFTLTQPNGQTITVTTTAATALYGATLADGVAVGVEGTLDTTTQTLVATRVDVCGAARVRSPHAGGTASQIDASAGTFTLTIDRAHGFTVTQAALKVVTDASTVYRGDAGATLSAADFFAALATTPHVGVEGTYDAATNTLTATHLRVVDPSKNGGWERRHGHFRGEGGLARWGNGALRG